MIENQSDNIDIKENDVSNQDNASEDTSSPEDKIIENKQLFDLESQLKKIFSFFDFEFLSILSSVHTS